MISLSAYPELTLLNFVEPSRAVSDSDVVHPSLTVAVCDASPTHSVEGGLSPDIWRPSDKTERWWVRHQGGANYLFCDGHVKWYPPHQIVNSNRPVIDFGIRPSFAVSDKASDRTFWENKGGKQSADRGSWLNVAEIELSVMPRQCLNRRISKADIVAEVSAWEIARNGLHGTVKWQFTTRDTRVKRRRLYPELQKTEVQEVGNVLFSTG